MLSTPFPLWRRRFLLYVSASFLLHVTWENVHAPLYEGYVSFSQHFWPCLRATFGDIGFMLAIYGALAIAHRDIFWIAHSSASRRARTWILSVLIGVILALGAEWWAISVADRWQYGPLMPLLPVLGIGVTPVLQMVVVPLLALLFALRAVGRRLA